MSINLECIIILYIPDAFAVNYSISQIVNNLLNITRYIALHGSVCYYVVN